MRVPFRIIGFAAAVTLFSAIGFFIISQFGLSDSGTGWVPVLKNLLLLAAMALGYLSFVIISSVLPLLAIVEVFTSGNDNRWKILWGVILFFAGFIGLVIYLLTARKELKEQVI